MRRGQIIMKAQNKYLLRVYVGRIEGKKKYLSKQITGTKKQAEQELMKWLREMDKGHLVPK